MNRKILEEIGLTDSESKIYLNLLEKGASLAGTISRNTGIHRRSVYDSIERLIQKGLVSYIKSNNRKYFEAVDPERLIEILHKKEEDIKSVMPELKILQKMSDEKRETLFFRGKAALKSAFDDQLNQNEEIMILGATGRCAEIVPYYFPHYDKNRAKKKLAIRAIFNESERESQFIKDLPLAEIRYAPKDVLSDTSTYMYGNNTCIVAWKSDPIAVLIRESIITNSYKSWFEHIWKNAKK